MRRMDDLLTAIRTVLAPHDHAAGAQAWIAAGFEDPEEIAEWLQARCFTPDAARRLDEAGLTPAQAANIININNCTDTLGAHIMRGSLSLAEARRIITDAFWNS